MHSFWLKPLYYRVKNWSYYLYGYDKENILSINDFSDEKLYEKILKKKIQREWLVLAFETKNSQSKFKIS